jgi:hypothetical protein
VGRFVILVIVEDYNREYVGLVCCQAVEILLLGLGLFRHPDMS